MVDSVSDEHQVNDNGNRQKDLSFGKKTMQDSKSQSNIYKNINKHNPKE